MKRPTRLPLTVVLGLVPLLGYGDSRNMAAQIDSEEAPRERTLYRSPGGARRATQPVAPLPGVEFEMPWKWVTGTCRTTKPRACANTSTVAAS